MKLLVYFDFAIYGKYYYWLYIYISLMESFDFKSFSWSLVARLPEYLQIRS